MKIIAKKLAALKPDPKNINTHSSANLDAIRRSLAEFGQQKPIVISAAGVIIAGNGTFEAARLLGWREIQCVISDLKGSKQRAYSIADTQTAKLSRFDSDALAAAIRELEESEALATGFTPSEIESFLKDSAAAVASIASNVDLDPSQIEALALPSEKNPDSLESKKTFAFRVVCQDARTRGNLIKTLRNAGHTCEESP